VLMERILTASTLSYCRICLVWIGPIGVIRVTNMLGRAYCEDEENQGDDPSSPRRHRVMIGNRIADGGIVQKEVPIPAPLAAPTFSSCLHNPTCTQRAALPSIVVSFHAKCLPM